MMLATTGMCGRITLSVSFHPVTVRCSRQDVANRDASRGKNRPAKAAIYSVAGWFAGLGKLLESVKLLTKHAFYSWRDLLESANDESTDTIRELNAGVVAVAGQLPGQASGNTGRLGAGRGLPRAAKLHAARHKRHAACSTPPPFGSFSQKQPPGRGSIERFFASCEYVCSEIPP